MNELQVKEIVEREAKHGEKMISLDVRFWTESLKKRA